MVTVNNPMLFADLVSRGTFPLWLAILLMVVAVGVSFALYFSESLKLATPRRIALALLRSLLLIAIIWLIRKPVWVRDVTLDKTRPVAVLIDNSQSMTLKDPRLHSEDRNRVAIARDQLAPNASIDGASNTSENELPSRLEVVQEVFKNPRLDLNNQLRTRGPLQPFLFGTRVRGFADDNSWVKSFNGEDAKSQMLDALHEINQRDERDLPGAVVLVTDGRDNGSSMTWDEIAQEAAKLQTPVFVYGVGGSGIGYLQLKDAAIPDTLFIDDTVNIPFRYRARGLKDVDLEMSLTLNGKVVASKRVPIGAVEEGTDNLSFTPTKEDVSGAKQDLIASIKVVRGNETLEDRFTKSVRVADRKVKMLYIESNPRWEFKFMQRAFLRDRRVQPTFILINGDRKAMESGAPFLANFPETRADLFSYDLLVIGDVDANYFTGEQRNWIKDFVAEGGGLIVIAGRLHGPATWLGTPLADLLPVEVPSIKFPQDDTRRPLEFHPVPSEQGQRSPILSLSDDPVENKRIWATLPGMYWNYPVTKLRPAAISLLDHSREKIANQEPMPVVAMHYFGKGLVYFSGIEETWRWRYNEGDRFFTRYWGQVVYAIGLPHTLGSKSAQMAIAGGEAILGKPGQVFARLFTPEFRPLTRERVTAQIERLDPGPNEERFRNVFFESVPNQPGEYTATLPNDRVGRYVLKVESGAEVSSIDYRVILPPEHELAPEPMNEAALRSLAEQTGGKFYREETLHQMAKDIPSKEVQITQRRETLLWNNWYVWSAIVALVSMEWLLRKFSNLN
jgi:hypothetical protein